MSACTELAQLGFAPDLFSHYGQPNSLANTHRGTARVRARPRVGDHSPPRPAGAGPTTSKAARLAGGFASARCGNRECLLGAPAAVVTLCPGLAEIESARPREPRAPERLAQALAGDQRPAPTGAKSAPRAPRTGAPRLSSRPLFSPCLSPPLWSLSSPVRGELCTGENFGTQERFATPGPAGPWRNVCFGAPRHCTPWRAQPQPVSGGRPSRY